MVQLGQQPGRRGHQATAVKGDDRLLTALGFDLHHHRSVAARGRLPADASHLVTRQVIAQAGECGGCARRPGPAQPGHDSHPAAQHQLVTLDGKDVGVDGGLLLRLDSDLAGQPAAGPPAPKVDRAETVGPAVGRLDRVFDRQQAFTVEPPGEHAPVRPEVGGYVVGQLGRESGGVAVRNQHLDRLDFAQRERLGQNAARHEARPARETPRIRQDESSHRRVIEERHDDEYRAQQQKQEQDGTGDQCRQQPRPRNERQAPSRRISAAGSRGR